MNEYILLPLRARLKLIFHSAYFIVVIINNLVACLVIKDSPMFYILMIDKGLFLWGLFTMGVKIYYFIYIYDIICNTDICIIVNKFLQLAPPKKKTKKEILAT